MKILIITIVLAIGIYLVYRAMRTEGFGSFYDTQNPYTSSQQDYHWNKYNRGLVFTDGLQDAVARIDQATGSVDTQYNTIKPQGLAKYFSVDPLPGMFAQNQQCASVTQPSLLPAHSPNTSSGCGWWYVDDDNTASTAARGNQSGPFDVTLPSRLIGGVWIWDLALAQKKEDIKRCRRIKSCEMIDLFPGECGFCSSLNISVPVDKFGKCKYPTDPLYNCGENPVLNPARCPVPAAPPVINPDGTLSPASVVKSICDPVGGKLSMECLISLALGVGLSKSGAILSILNGDPKGYMSTDGNLAFNYTSANAIVSQDCKIVYDPAFVGAGVCSRNDAMQYYLRIYNAVTTGTTTRCREAAGFLAFGTPFDPCNYDPNQKGPFDVQCLQRTFRESGCQPDGTNYPTLENKRSVDILTWSGVKAVYDALRANSNSTDYQVQSTNALQCLGVTISPKIKDCGDTRGCEVIWYAWENDYNFPVNSTTKQTYLGRQISANIPNFDATYGSTFNPYARTSTICFRARTNLINTGKPRSATLWVMGDDGIVIKWGAKTIMNVWYDQSPTAYTSTPFVLASSTPLDMYWYLDYGGATFIPKLSNPDGSYDYIPSTMIQMDVPSGFPVCRWDFYMGTYNERKSILSSKPNNLQFGTLGNKKCAMFTDPNAAIIVNNKLRAGAFTTLTFMIYLTSLTGFSTLFAFINGSVKCDADASQQSTDFIGGGYDSEGGLWIMVMPTLTGGMPSKAWMVGTASNVITLNQWTHVTFAFDADFMGAGIFVNGNEVGRTRDETINGQFHNNMITQTSTIGIGPFKVGCNGFPLSCGIAWSHWFDYTFTAANAQQDMNMVFTKSAVYPEDSTTGWVAQF